MLLTSGQVSMAISSAIVVAFTAALFFSGYAIQQRTVRHLRAAIRPETGPHIFLPDRFRDDTTELEDGTIVMLDEYDRPVRMKGGRVSVGKAPPAAPSPQQGEGGEQQEGERQYTDEVPEITFQESMPEMVGEEQQQIVLEDADVRTLELKRSEIGDAEEQPIPIPGEEGGEVRDLEKPREQAQPPPPTQQQQQQQPRPHVAPWEVRREDMPQEKAAQSLEQEEGEKPISRAERRRLIKEEIHRLSQGDEPLYYQRRLW